MPRHAHQRQHIACICDLETDNLKAEGQQKILHHGVTCNNDVLPEFPGGIALLGLARGEQGSQVRHRLHTSAKLPDP